MMKYCKSLIPILCVMALSSGCTHHYKMHQKDMDELRSLAESAQRQASQAYSAAQNALSVANDANLAAGQTRNSLETALECCQDNRARIEGSLRETMLKGR